MRRTDAVVIPSKDRRMKIWSDDAAFVYSHRAPPIDPGLLRALSTLR
jgi:hypothetical protein